MNTQESSLMWLAEMNVVVEDGDWVQRYSSRLFDPSTAGTAGRDAVLDGEVMFPAAIVEFFWRVKTIPRAAVAAALREVWLDAGLKTAPHDLSELFNDALTAREHLMDDDLECVLGRDRFGDWNLFFSKIGRPILEALAFAHSHRTVHRDIKPSNILITAEGIPKVCDFGISKIRNFLEPGVTLAHFASFPYAPPEIDDGSYSYSRDVFGFVALSIAALTDARIENHKELAANLEKIKIDEPLKRLLRRSISLDNPGERQINAAVLLAELDRLVPPPPIQKFGRILIGLTNKVKQIIDYDLALKAEADIQKFVEADLQSASYIHDPGEPRPAPDGSPPLGRSIRLLGGRYGYVAIMAPPSGEKLLLVSALEQSSSESERNREEAAPARYEFCFGGVPKKGVLVVDTSKADVALDRQKAAIDAVRFGRSINPLLGNYIVEPSSVPVSAPREVDFIQQSMDDNKRDAVYKTSHRLVGAVALRLLPPHERS